MSYGNDIYTFLILLGLTHAIARAIATDQEQLEWPNWSASANLSFYFAEWFRFFKINCTWGERGVLDVYH